MGMRNNINTMHYGLASALFQYDMSTKTASSIYSLLSLLSLDASLMVIGYNSEHDIKMPTIFRLHDKNHICRKSVAMIRRPGYLKKVKYTFMVTSH